MENERAEKAVTAFSDRKESMSKIWNDGYGGSSIGRVDSDGRIWNDGYGGSIVGRVDSDGRIWNDGYGGSIIGRVDSDGKIWNDGYGGSIIGRVDSDGRIWNDGYGGSIIGRVDSGNKKGGAALLLLLHGEKRDGEKRDDERTNKAINKFANSGCGTKLLIIWIIGVLIVTASTLFGGGDWSFPIMFAIITAMPIGLIIKVMSWFGK